MANRLLILRFSALGDILMTLPLTYVLARRYPDLNITFVSRPRAGSLFGNMPPNVHFLGIEMKGWWKRNTSFWIFRQLRALRPDAVCDLHYVLRSRIISFWFRLTGVKVSHIDKDRRGTKRFLKQRPLTPRKTTVERYAEALDEAGYPVTLDEDFCLVEKPGTRRGIGIAPFAAHKGKIFPLDKMETLVAKLSTNQPVFLFGAGANEISVLERWAAKYPNVTNMAGRTDSLMEECRTIAHLKLMVSMDSANMHLAALAGTRVVSIWGSTHPLSGFLGWRQSLQDCIGTDLPCRPCSIYGNKTCARGDWACLNGISVEEIYNKIKTAL